MDIGYWGKKLIYCRCQDKSYISAHIKNNENTLKCMEIGNILFIIIIIFFWRLRRIFETECVAILH